MSDEDSHVLIKSLQMVFKYPVDSNKLSGFCLHSVYKKTQVI